MPRFTTAAALLAAAVAVQADSITPLPESANDLELKWQPVMDFDSDSCYNTAAISPDGTLNPGLDHTCTGVTENCDQVNRLWNSNTYSRSRCNNGVCAIMYEYYFEKDVVTGACVVSGMEGGHTHEWENVVVFVKDDKAAMVAGSCHGEYEKDNAWTTEPRMEDTHPKVVYHKDGGLTHCFRMGNKGDDDIENEEGVWYRSPLVGWMGWPGKEENYPLYYSMIDNWSGGIGPKIDDEKFGENLAKAQGSFFPEFDPYVDE